jgi:hypothetical protein
MQEDREPLRTYEQAINRLSFRQVSGRFTETQIELGVQTVADVFWFSDEKVRNDLRKATLAVERMAAPAPSRRRGRFASGMIWGA